jgi:cell division septation protein DedD
MGYKSASVEIFDRGKYAVILVDRFDNMADAERLQKKLKADKVAAYIKLKD